MTDTRSTYAQSPRRDAWRAQLLHDQVSEEMAKRRHAAALSRAVVTGIIIGALGSAAFFMV